MKQKDKSVPSASGTIETLGFWSRTRLSDCQHSSIVPSGTDSSLKTLTQHFVLGYFRQVPAGLIFSNHQRTCAILIRALMLQSGSHRLAGCHFERNDVIIVYETAHYVCREVDASAKRFVNPMQGFQNRLDHWKVDDGNWDNKRPVSSVLE